jgi:hypothetical protein
MYGWQILWLTTTASKSPLNQSPCRDIFSHINNISHSLPPISPPLTYPTNEGGKET